MGWWQSLEERKLGRLADITTAAFSVFPGNFICITEAAGAVVGGM